MDIDPHRESAWSRAQRDTGEATRSVRFLLAVLIVEAMAAVPSYLITTDPDRSAPTKVAAVVIAQVGGPFALLALVFLAAWVTAPVRQRDEARAELASQPALTVEFSHQNRLLSIGMKNDGPTLRDAVVNVLVPKRNDVKFRLADARGWPVERGSY